VDVCQSQLGENIIKLAFQFASSAPQVATCLIGPTNREQLLTNLAWMNEMPDPDMLREVQEVLAPIRNRLWVESGSEENIALASGGFWAEGHGSENKIRGIKGSEVR
jgi:predicted aldo/keto reductase-like oxidoreductase